MMHAEEAGVGRSDLRRLHQREEENRKLKQLMAELSLDKVTPQAVVAKGYLVSKQTPPNVGGALA